MSEKKPLEVISLEEKVNNLMTFCNEKQSTTMKVMKNIVPIIIIAATLFVLWVKELIEFVR